MDLGVFRSVGTHLPSEKLILPYFSSLSMVAVSVPFPEVRNRKGTESGLDTFDNWTKKTEDSSDIQNMSLQTINVQKSLIWKKVLFSGNKMKNRLQFDKHFSEAL